MNSKFIFQCNANDSSGLGHLMRCLNIANAIKKVSINSVIIFNGDFNDFAQRILAENQFSILLVNDLNQYKDYCLIIDDYDITQQDIDKKRALIDKFIIIDDFYQYELDQLDLIINFRLDAEENRYNNNQVCLGLNYFPFKNAIIKVRENKINDHNNKIKNIYIFIGGTDKNNTGQKLVELINQVVSNKHLYLIDNSVTKQNTSTLSNNRLTLLPLTFEIEKHYQSADIFITGGGLSKYEVAFCTIPNATISQNSGQAEDTKIFAYNNLTYNLGMSEDKPKVVQQLLIDFLSLKHQKNIKKHCIEKFCTTSTIALAERILKVTS